MPWVRNRHVIAVYITPQTLNFVFHYFIIRHVYPLEYYLKVKLLSKLYIILIWSDGDTFNYNCIITPKMAGLLAETCW